MSAEHNASLPRNSASDLHSGVPGAKFSFMERMANLCYRLLPEEAYANNHGGKVYFWEKNGEPIIIPRDQADPKTHTGIRIEKILCRAGIIPKEWPREIGARTRVHPIELQEHYAHDAEVTGRSESLIKSMLTERKKRFSEADVVTGIDCLLEGDIIFLHFKGEGQMYSITISEKSRMVDITPDKPGVEKKQKNVALCDVIFRVKNMYGRYEEAHKREAIIQLPIKKGAGLKVTWRWAPITELDGHIVEKIQHKSLHGNEDHQQKPKKS